MGTRLAADRVSIDYGENPIVKDLTLAIPDGKITTIIGPNGCGKSTLLRGLARLRPARAGHVVLDGQQIHHWSTVEVARRMGLLGQQPAPPAGILVEELVHRGRYPHQSFFQPPTRQDQLAVDKALTLAGMQALRKRPVDHLSGGQRQRAWIAMVLAQETPLMLLDEPTTYLDLAHQIEVMDLVRLLNRDEGRTIVMVLHDVNEAARVSDYIVAMDNGQIVAEGKPSEVITEETLTQLYGVPCDISYPAGVDHPFYVPRSGESPQRASEFAAFGAFSARQVSAGYGGAFVVRDLSLDLPAGAVTAIIGPNASGKSTFLRTCCRLLQPSSGAVHLNGENVRSGSHKDLARRLSLLLQGVNTPAGFLVEDLVSSGRLPHQSLLRQWRQEDENAVEAAMQQCDLCGLRNRPLETLSGGQQRRCWFGMALAQDTPVLILDEPTTFLDPAAQIALLDIVRRLNHELGRTVVMVLHDLNLAARYADYLVVLHDGQVAAKGTPRDVVTPDMLRTVFGVEAEITPDPRTGAPLVIPLHLTHPIHEDLGPLETGELALVG
ncbi:MAG: ABC transporter ATP-binding protein [Thermomicrobiales bacterium]|nr:ABC transporter ATP-binding protein [Thermomicrobiales bacterium]